MKIVTAFEDRKDTEIYNRFCMVAFYLTSLYYELFGYEAYHNDIAPDIGGDDLDEEMLQANIRVNRALEEKFLKKIEAKRLSK